MNTVFLFIFW